MAAGVDSDRIIWDPGLGFAKTHEQNLELLKIFFAKNHFRCWSDHQPLHRMDQLTDYMDVPTSTMCGTGERPNNDFNVSKMSVGEMSKTYIINSFLLTPLELGYYDHITGTQDDRLSNRSTLKPNDACRQSSFKYLLTEILIYQR